jgi:antirestriction protein
MGRNHDMEQQPHGGTPHPEANSYGTDDPETQAHIENVRIGADRERRADRARLEQLVGDGLTADEAETVIEFEHSQPDATATAAGAEHQPTYRPRVYIRDISSYRQGLVHDMWLDANQEPADVDAVVAEYLRRSPVGEAAVWAVHGSYGFGGLSLYGCRDTALISRLGRGVAEHGAAYAAWVGIVGTQDRDLLDTFTDYHVGSYDSRDAWARTIAEDLEWHRQLDRAVTDPLLRRCLVIDYAKAAREAAHGWDVLEGHDGRVHVFLR